jgi:FkbH-like protein
MDNSLFWLPEQENWRGRLRALSTIDDPKRKWQTLVEMANSRLDFLTTTLLDRALVKYCSSAQLPPSEFKPVRLAILSSSTVDHLLPSLRVAALRRGIFLTTYLGDYGQYLQELLDQSSGLGQFKPDMILVALDTRHLVETEIRRDGEDPAQSGIGLLKTIWKAASERFNCSVLQQTLLPVHENLLGSNEQRFSVSPADATRRLNQLIRESADEVGVHLIAIDSWSARQGLDAWHSSSLWHHAKQEIAPAMAPFYGDLVGRVIGALRGRTSKCLVLDLDNTIWGGVIGDDGISGIALGQNSATGEAFVEFQRYVLRLSRRGVILAVCSKNDEANALQPFEEHTEMVLKRSDIACFVANWQDKASNLRKIAETLNIGIDSLVFVDDNPYERAQVRSELPMVAVPEIGEDPSSYPSILGSAGYFEAVAITEEDATRTAQYRENAERQKLQAGASDMDSYLKSLEMVLVGGPIDEPNLKRVTQLINKTNQFNLTTRRYTEQDVARFMADDSYFTIQLRLLDRFGDSGIICIVIGRVEGEKAFLDTWLMSCRVLGRQVEEATLNIVAAQALEYGANKLVGEYLPTSKNGMVKLLYEKLGFQKTTEETDGHSIWSMDLAQHTKLKTHVTEKFAVAAKLPTL